MGDLRAASRRKLLEGTLQRLGERIAVVEGQKDLAALAIASPGTRCVPCSGRKLDVVARLAAEKAGGLPVVILTDYDSEGERKAAALEELLLAQPVKLDRGLRLRVKAVFGARTIEELPSSLERVKEEIGFG